MLSGSTRPPATAALPLARVGTSATVRVADRGDLLTGAAGMRHRSLLVDPCPDAAPVERGAAPGAREAGQTRTRAGTCPLGPRSQIVCADNASCACPLSGRITDAERAAMNGIVSQAARLATALSWVLALVGLAAIVLLVRWVG